MADLFKLPGLVLHHLVGVSDPHDGYQATNVADVKDVEQGFPRILYALVAFPYGMRPYSCSCSIPLEGELHALSHLVEAHQGQELR